MDERAIEARRKYHREWARKNPDKVRAATERYWTRKGKEAQAAEAEATETGKPATAAG